MMFFITFLFAGLSIGSILQLGSLPGVSANAYQIRTRHGMEDRTDLLRELAEIGPENVEIDPERQLSVNEFPIPNPFYRLPQPRIVGGGDIKEADYLPELVIVDPSRGCHGVLFSNDIVVTTAICAGAKDTNHPNMKVGIVNRDIFTPATGETVAIHPCYNVNDREKRNDLAVIKLDTPATGNAFVGSPINQNPVFPEWNGEDMDFFGYGQLDEEVTETPLYLQNLTVQYLKYCQGAYPQFEPEHHLCVVYPPKSGPCLKDNAAPLYFCGRDSNNCNVVGLLSFFLGGDTEPTCTGNLPDVFVRLSSYYDWLYKQNCKFTDPAIRPAVCDDISIPEPCCDNCPSQIPTPAPTAEPWFCFSEESTVDVQGKGETRMADLSIRDKVRTMGSYEPVYAFAHRDTNAFIKYLHISTENVNDPLEMTEDHLLKVNNRYIPARDVRMGDNLTNVGHGQAVVKEVANIYRMGVYAPLTPSGTLAVNGIQTSAYVSLQKRAKGKLLLGASFDTGISFHLLNHLALTPIRMACIGISSTFCAIENIQEDTGYPCFVSVWFQLVEWFEGKPLPVQTFLLIVFFCIVGPLFAVEACVGSALGPSFILLGLLVILQYHYFWKQFVPSKIKQT